MAKRPQKGTWRQGAGAGSGDKEAPQLRLSRPAPEGQGPPPEDSGVPQWTPALLPPTQNEIQDTVVNHILFYSFEPGSFVFTAVAGQGFSLGSGRSLRIGPGGSFYWGRKWEVKVRVRWLETAPPDGTPAPCPHPRRSRPGGGVGGALLAPGQGFHSKGFHDLTAGVGMIFGHCHSVRNAGTNGCGWEGD